MTLQISQLVEILNELPKIQIDNKSSKESKSGTSLAEKLDRTIRDKQLKEKQLTDKPIRRWLNQK